MALRSGLAVYAYSVIGYGQRKDYAPLLDELEFASVAPAGCADMTGRILLPTTRLPYSELGILQRIAVQVPGGAVVEPGTALPAPLGTVYQGEISDTEIGLDANGEYISLSAQGYGASLRSDAITTSYLNQSIQAIAIDQITGHSRPGFGLPSGYGLPFDADTTQLFPDNPAGTISPAYARQNIEEVLLDLCAQAGTSALDYIFG